MNIVGNAIKFTDQGEVIVQVGQLFLNSMNTDQVVLQFSVRDTGIGIAPEKQRSILEAFAQADSSYTRRFGGLGLGLTIANRLINMMGGDLQLQSEPDKGSTFSFTLRVGAVKDVEPVPGAGRCAAPANTAAAQLRS
ncbi:MAG TPA: ATP-binding protein [Bryobacteraceae bacterium]|nr:ATP-binding protein [Bryobacteraceae bacterium]